ncbi:sirohydrochlorin chelatase [Skermania piniformis]|uniref:Sirohydrochlorin chelatase n=1 Tax=Skermania pinensis TaxID=39122 RepID=A0ABX8S9L3_9ACTN|nr:sirohydrochlorin chelatase [Skermania piniformis]QXQ14156.1 sirohydrochlorin chelatase [Skermania piniformis]
MTTLLVAHGTRSAAGVAGISELAAAVSANSAGPVQLAFVDVLGPHPTQVLAGLGDHPVVLVPLFLSSGYHVRVDVPAAVTDSAHSRVTVTRALGPSPELARAMLDRLLGAGWRPGDAVVLAAAGTSDRHAQGDVRAAAAMLSALVGSRVRIAFAAPSRGGGGYPPVAEVVRQARIGGRRVAVASYLLAEGLFQQRLRECGADVVAEPLGIHPAVVRLIARRRGEAVLVAA